MAPNGEQPSQATAGSNVAPVDEASPAATVAEFATSVPVVRDDTPSFGAADLQYFTDSLRAWHERGVRSRPLQPPPGAAAATAAAASAMRRYGEMPTPRRPSIAHLGILSAPEGGSLAMRGAAAAAMKRAATKGKGNEKQPLLTKHEEDEGERVAPPPATPGESNNDDAPPAEGTAGENFDYNALREALSGLTVAVLVELWVEQHRAMVAAGLKAEAKTAYDAVMEVRRGAVLSQHGAVLLH